jgi:hypothetical protein
MLTYGSGIYCVFELCNIHVHRWEAKEVVKTIQNTNMNFGKVKKSQQLLVYIPALVPLVAR